MAGGGGVGGGGEKGKVFTKMIPLFVMNHLLKAEACVPEYSLIASAIASYS